MKYLISLILLSTTFFCFSQEANLEKWTLTRIVDGDTVYAIDSLGKESKFRLIGIDTPESRHPFKPVEAYSKEATEALTQLLESYIIYVEYDIERVDRYGRTLAYIYNEDKVQVNAELVRIGLAKITTYPPNVKYVDTYVACQNKARQEEKGIWSGL